MLFLFVDGLGLGGALEDLFPFLLALAPTPLDATLGVEGLPQSGTGQTALLTGENAARLLGHHQGPFPSPRLRPLLAQGLYAWAKGKGLRVLHANGYRPDYLRRATEGKGSSSPPSPRRPASRAFPSSPGPPPGPSPRLLGGPLRGGGQGGGLGPGL